MRTIFRDKKTGQYWKIRNMGLGLPVVIDPYWLAFADLKDMEILLLCYMEQYANLDGACLLTKQQLGDLLGKTNGTITQKIYELIDLGLVEKPNKAAKGEKCFFVRRPLKQCILELVQLRPIDLLSYLGSRETRHIVHEVGLTKLSNFKEETTNFSNPSNRRGRKPNPKKKLTDYPGRMVRLAEKVRNTFIEKTGKKKTQTTEADLLRDLDTLDKLERLDGFDQNEIQEVLEWGLEDSFWWCNMQACAPLRAKRGGKDSLTKFEKIRVAKIRDANQKKKRNVDTRGAMQKYIEDNSPKDNIVKKVEQYYKPRNLIERYQLYKYLNDLIEYLDTFDWDEMTRIKGNFFEAWDGDYAFIYNFVEWLEQQDWISNRSIKMFDRDGKLWPKFFKYAKGEIGRIMYL